MRTDTQQEKLFAVIISGGVFGLLAGGFGFLLLGFICHIIINSRFKTEFA